MATIEKLSLHLAHVRIIGSIECGKTRNDFSMIIHQKQYKNIKYYAEIWEKQLV